MEDIYGKEAQKKREVGNNQWKRNVAIQAFRTDCETRGSIPTDDGL